MGRVHVVVDSRVAIEAATAGTELLDLVREEFVHKNPKRDALKHMGYAYSREPKRIVTWADEEGGEWLTVPRGGLKRVREVFRREGVTYDLEDCRTEGAADLRGRIPEHRVSLYPHQREALEAALARETCIIKAPTGSGKTCMGFALAAQTGLPTLVIVNGRALFDQWLERAKSELGLQPRQVGVLQGSRRDIRPLTLATQGALAEHGVDEELAEAFGCVIFDEVQLAAAPTIFRCVDPFAARYRVGISADQRRKDRKEFLIHDLFGEVAKDVDREELEDQGRVLDVEVLVVPTEFRADWYGVEDEEADSASGEVREVDFGRLLGEMAADGARNVLAADWAWRAAGAELETPGFQVGQVLVMAHRREHCRELAALIVARGLPAGFLIGGEDYRSDFVRTRERIAAGERVAGVGTYQAIGQGVDMPAVGALVAATPLAANRQKFAQVRGRICRVVRGKRRATLVYLWDRHVFGLAHLRNLVRWNRTVRVRADGGWVEGREYLKRARQRGAA